MSTDTIQMTGEITVLFECPQCGQRYEIQLVPNAIFATTLEGEAVSRLSACKRCGQLYRIGDDEPHTCREEGGSPLDAGNEVEGT